MIASALAIVIYLGMVYFKIWEMIPAEHKWWVGAALVLLFVWTPAERTLIIRKVTG